MVQVIFKKALGADIARQRWCQCCDEFGEMIQNEVKTNPRYNELDPKTLTRHKRPSVERDTQYMLLLCGVGYYIYTIMSLAYEELNKSQEDTTVSDHCPNSDVVDNHNGNTNIVEQ